MSSETAAKVAWDMVKRAVKQSLSEGTPFEKEGVFLIQDGGKYRITYPEVSEALLFEDFDACFKIFHCLTVARQCGF